MGTITAQPLVRFLDTVGDGSGSKNVIGNYSAVAETFLCTPPVGKIFTFYSLTLHITANIAGNVNAADYAAVAGGLTNGYLLTTKNASGTIFNLTDDVPITDNEELEHLGAGDTTVRIIEYSGNDKSIIVYIDFFEQFGKPIVLKGDNGEYFEGFFNDDFSAIIDHHFILKGNVQPPARS